MDAMIRELKNAGISSPFGDVDVGKYKDQAKQIWEMLDEMAESDPQAYSKFVKQQMEAARSEKSGRKTVIPDVGFCLMGKISKLDASSRKLMSTSGEKRPALPDDMKPGSLIYLNLVSHSVILPPLSAGDKKPLPDVEKRDKSRIDLYALLNMEIPLAIGNPRPVRGTARSEWAVDVLLHSWVIRKAESFSDFLPFFIEFLLGSVFDEIGVQVEQATTKQLEGCDYVGGSSKTAGGSTSGIIERGARKTEDPVPFDLGPLREGTDGAETSKSVVPQVAPSLPSALPPVASPHDLLRELNKDSVADAVFAKPPAVTIAGKSKLIEELVPSEPKPFCSTTQAAQSDRVVVTFHFDPTITDVSKLSVSLLDLFVDAREARITLPEELLKSDIPASQVQLTVSCHLDQDVDPDTATAKFIRASACLNVSLPFR